MTMTTDDEERFRAERATELRERDWQREPRAFQRRRRELAGRDAFRIMLAERAAATWQDVPGWRQPLYGFPSSAEHGSAERMGIRGALLDLATDEPQTFKELAAGVGEHWGDATSVQIGVQLCDLVRECELRREGGGYVRVEPTESDE